MQQFADEFEITDIILGTGGQGQVRLAYHVTTGRQVVVKIVDLVDIVGKLGPEGARWARRVKQEADYLSKLDHVSLALEHQLKEAPLTRLSAQRDQVGWPLLLELHPVSPGRGLISPSFQHTNLGARYVFMELATGGDLLSFLKQRTQIED